MAKAAEARPVVTRTLQPADQAALAEAVRDANASRTAIYPIGGGTSVDFGLPARQEGIGLSLAGLHRVVDYPARDMTITVEAGITMRTLAETLAQEKQRLPIDAPQAERATLGGVIATNFSGPRRFSQGTIRDYVIGITAVDGRGVAFSGGGRVVKNVAGYDFCKLLCGSLGTLGVITQVTLKLKPQPQASGFLAASLAGIAAAEPLLAALIQSQTTPAAVELLSGPGWRSDAALSMLVEGAAALLVGFEGTKTEVDWMLKRLRAEWQEQGVADVHQPANEHVDAIWQKLTEFPAAPGTVLKANLVPSAVCRFMQMLRSLDRECTLQAHAGNGVVLARMAGLAGSELSQTIVRKLQSAARQAGGSLVVLAAGEGLESTRQVIWGSAPDDLRIMQAVKQQFDPLNLLNPGRFVYGVP